MALSNKTPESIFGNLTTSFLKNFFEGITNQNNRQALTLAAIFGGVILFLAGVDPVRLVFRKNIGRKGIDLARVVVSGIAFLIIAFVSFHFYMNFTSEDLWMGDKLSFLIFSIFYSLVAIYISIKGAITLLRNEKSVYRGDSYILAFLMKGGWSQNRVRYVGEPLFLLALGIFFSGINLFLGLPLVVCAISVWINIVVEFYLAKNKPIIQTGADSSETSTYAEYSVVED